MSPRAVSPRTVSPRTVAARVATRHLVATHLRTQPGASFAVALLVFVLAGLAVFGPLALRAVADDAVQYRLDAVSPAVRDIETAVEWLPLFAPGDPALSHVPEQYDDDWGSFDSELEQLRRDAGAVLTDAMLPAQYVVRSNALSEYETGVQLLSDPFFETRIQIVDGRLPGEPPPETEWNRALEELLAGGGGILGGARTVVSGAAGALPPIDIVLSAASAEALGWRIGETRPEIEPEQDPAAEQVSGETIYISQIIVVPKTLVGTFEAVDGTDPYWLHVPTVVTPAVGSDPDGVPVVQANSYTHPEAARRLAYLSGPPLTRAWYPLDVAAIDSANAAAVLAELRRFTSLTHEAPGNFGPVALRFQSGAIPTLETAIAEGRSMAALVAMLIAGPVGVAAAVLVLAARMLIERRRPALELLSARGAAPGQLRGLVAIEGLVVGAAPAVLGAAAGLAIGVLVFDRVPGVAELAPLLLVPAVLAVGPAAVLAASVGRTRRGVRADAPARRSTWRPIAEWAIVGLAAVATTVLVVRGVGDPGAALDPLVTLAPLLLALVVCIVTLRVYPILLRALQARLRRGPGFVGFLGAARALRDPAAGLVPVLALVVGVSIAVSSAVMLSTLEAGVDDAARQAAGADLQLEAARFDAGAGEVVAGIPGVTAVAPVAQVRGVSIHSGARREVSTVYLVDQQALAAVQGPGGLIPADVSLGDGGLPMPLVASEAAMDSLDLEGALIIEGEPAEVVWVSTDAAPFSPRAAWVLADEAYSGGFGRPESVSTILVALDDDADAATVAAAAQEALGNPNIRWLSPESVRAAVEEGPAASGLRLTLIASVALAAALCAIAVMMTLVLGTRSRSRILALLQTLGAPRRTGSGIIAWELWPASAAAVVAGALFGAALPVLLLRVVDLRPFTGGAAQPAYAVDPGILALAIGGFLVATVLFTLVALAISRRVRASAILRTVEDS